MDEIEELKRNAEFLDEIEGEDLELKKENKSAVQSASVKSNLSKKLSPAQSFIVSLLVFFVILIFGLFIMLVTGKMVLPF